MGTMVKEKPVGWRREHTRHVAAGKGIKTVQPKLVLRNRFILDALSGKGLDGRPTELTGYRLWDIGTGAPVGLDVRPSASQNLYGYLKRLEKKGLIKKAEKRAYGQEGLKGGVQWMLTAEGRRVVNSLDTHERPLTYFRQLTKRYGLSEASRLSRKMREDGVL